MTLPSDVQYNMADESLPLSTIAAENVQTQTNSVTSPCSSVCQSPPTTSPPPMMPPAIQGQTLLPVKRKRSINPQADENFVKALEAVRFGGIGFCKAARMFGVNNRTLWLEYKKRGYPISRLSIKNRVAKLDNTPSVEQQQISQASNEPSQSVLCSPHSVTMIGATFPADFRSYQDSSIMAPPSHITVQGMNFGQM